MYIKHIVIDGFKSYAQRTEVGPFDPMFNAITGLNGSGKSNILDAICFLLGISNLSQVRAGSLQELVYKSGQAGVTKATVTITFDNSDQKQSPLGYESHDQITVSRQVVIGGRNKYLINGSNAPPSRVQDLFRSVQLNVNNPHFLIMQGRITKVLNMKPPEILSMIEEAAGTRMYESKKMSAQKTIERKDTKLHEIETILDEEITPTLRRLRDERSSYLEYQKVTRELEHLNRLIIAFQFTQAEELRTNSADVLESLQTGLQETRTHISKTEAAIEEAKEYYEEMQRKRAEESQGPLKELEGCVDSQAKTMAVAEATLKHSKELLVKEEKNCRALTSSKEEDASLLSSKEQEVSARMATHQQLQTRMKQAEEAVMAAQQNYQAVSAGLTSGADGQNETLAAQKIARENELSSAVTQMKQAEMRLKSAEAELKERGKSVKENEKSYSKDKTAHDKLQREVARLRESLGRLDYQEGQQESLMSRREKLETEIRELRTSVDSYESRVPRLQFEYTAPTPGFDHSRVKGPVAKLIRLKDPATATALEVAAGGRLYHVVVDTEETAKLLLERGQLKKRCTFIPLNKIHGRSIPNDVVKRAQNLVGKSRARPALDLVEYPRELQAAMEYVFGGAFVCNTLEDAKQVAFAKGVQTRSVTLAGDVFDPAGTLSGGSRPHTQSVLVALQQVVEREEQLKEKRRELSDVEDEMKKLHHVATKYQELKDQLDSRCHEAEVVMARLEQSSQHQELLQLQALENSIVEQKEILKQAKDTEKRAKAQLKEIQQNIADAKGHRERELRKAESGLTTARKAAEEAVEAARSLSHEMDTLQLEVTELKGSIATQEEQIMESEAALSSLRNKVQEHITALTTEKEKLTKLKSDLEQHKAAMREQMKELQQQEKKIKALDKDISESGLKVRELEHQISKSQKDSREATQKVEVLLSKYDWIATDKEYFGQPNTAYDFGSIDPREARNKTEKLQDQKNKLGKSVNMRAMTMLGKAEEKCNDLMRKKKIVENDKAKISELIVELDQKKNEALQTAWQRVNQDFGSIFSTLLPGTSAKLAPPTGQTVLDGLEVKVAFGGVWKESLTELSGGQRSLVALSLILSLLLFKPAPLYILDEVDAALDLSHTQNIGQMLRSHFKYSQFIVVSLKDGMFSNANVLFKTKFVDGVSTVARYVNPRASSGVSSRAHEDKENGDGHSTATKHTQPASNRAKRPRTTQPQTSY